MASVQRSLFDDSPQPEQRKRRRPNRVYLPQRADHTGKKYGRLTAVRFSRSGPGRSWWIFHCDCGREVEKRIDAVLYGDCNSCGCFKIDVRRGNVADTKGKTRFVKNLVGRRFGRLVVVEAVGHHNRELGTSKRWRCVCDCGNETLSTQTNLQRGRAKSCGCWKAERSAQQGREYGPQNRTHGMTKSPEYRAWRSMRDRCGDPACRNYKNYGARGIAVCQRWRDSFEAFLEDMGRRPEGRYTLDRRDNDKGYNCGKCEECVREGREANCRWATYKEQLRNTRVNKLIECFGKTQCAAAWAEEYGLPMHVLNKRLYWGWPVDLAIATPLGVVPPDLKERRLPVDPIRRQKKRANQCVAEAIARGDLVKPEHCSHPGCTGSPVQAHHAWGYSKANRLRVQWLCKRHHEDAECGII